MFLPGAGVADVLGQAPDPVRPGQTLPSFGQNIAEGKFLDAGLQTAGAAGDVLLAMSPIIPPAAAVGTALKAPRAAKVASASNQLVDDLPTLKFDGTDNVDLKGKKIFPDCC